MLEAIRIQNFRSIEDVTLDLRQINLFIGANNTGKSNFLKALEFLGDFISGNKYEDAKNVEPFFNRKNEQGYVRTTAFTFFYTRDNGENYVYRLEIYPAFDNELSFSEILGTSEKTIKPDISMCDLNYIKDHFYSYVINIQNNSFYQNFNREVFFSHLIPNTESFCIYKANPKSEFSLEQIDNSLINRTNLFIYRYETYEWLDKFVDLIIYKPNPDLFSKSAKLQGTPQVSADGGNIVPFLFNLGQNHKKVYAQLEKDLASCVGDLVSISTPTDPQNPSELKIKFFDDFDNAYWADEVSEGVLYFLALLCIIHQPNPPKLLLLEEPEKGIHPVRLQEVMNFIFKLAEEKDIQIIMTSHSPLLLEEFKDIPESVFIFDKEQGQTVVRNLQKDIIEPENKQREAEGLPKSDYTSSLSSHWTVGLIGGVPK